MSQSNSTDHKRSSFLATIEPRDHSAETPRPARSLRFKTVIETTQHIVTLYFGEQAMLTDSAADECVLLVSGDIYQLAEAEVGPAILDLYRRRGLDFVKDLHGVFALLLIDRRASQLLIATDRMNSVKLLTSRQDETLIVSNSLYLHPLQGARIDRTAVACYLASTTIYNNRTLFEGVDMLDGASVYRLDNGKLIQHKYWQYIFSQSPTNASPQALQKDFGDLLIGAVGRRLRSKRPIYLSLTAGYDGCALMGILASQFKVGDVRCFTYAHGQAYRADSDEALGAKLAALVGYRHEIIEAFDGDAVTTLKRNGHLGGGMTRLCDEVDAWVRLGTEVENGPLPVMYTGDTLQLGGNWPVNSFDDIAAAAKLREFSLLSWLKPFIGDSRYHEFLTATHSEIERAVKRTPRVADGRDLRQMVRFDQYHSRATGTWREYYTGRYFEAVHPLLDNDVIDFILRLPFALRDDRKLYKATVTSMFPELFALPRADSASYATFWPKTIRQQSAELQAWIQSQPSPLDDVIEPEILLALLAPDQPSPTRTNVLMTSVLRRVYHVLKRHKWNRTALTRPWLFKTDVPVEKFLTSALILRSFLAEVA